MSVVVQSVGETEDLHLEFEPADTAVYDIKREIQTKTGEHLVRIQLFLNRADGEEADGGEQAVDSAPLTNEQLLSTLSEKQPRKVNEPLLLTMVVNHSQQLPSNFPAIFDSHVKDISICEFYDSVSLEEIQKEIKKGTYVVVLPDPEQQDKRKPEPVYAILLDTIPCGPDEEPDADAIVNVLAEDTIEDGRLINASQKVFQTTVGMLRIARQPTTFDFVSPINAPEDPLLSTFLPVCDPRKVSHLVLSGYDARDMLPGQRPFHFYVNGEIDVNADIHSILPRTLSYDLFGQISALTLEWSEHEHPSSTIRTLMRYADLPHDGIIESSLRNIGSSFRNIVELNLCGKWQEAEIDLNQQQLEILGTTFTNLKQLLISSSAENMEPLCSLTQLVRFANLGKMKTFSPLGEHLLKLQQIEFGNSWYCYTFGKHFHNGSCPTLGDLSGLTELTRFIWNGVLYFHGDYYDKPHQSIKPILDALLTLPTTVHVSLCIEDGHSSGNSVAMMPPTDSPNFQAQDCQLFMEVVERFDLQFNQTGDDEHKKRNKGQIYTSPLSRTMSDAQKQLYNESRRKLVPHMFGFGDKCCSTSQLYRHHNQTWCHPCKACGLVAAVFNGLHDDIDAEDDNDEAESKTKKAKTSLE